MAAINWGLIIAAATLIGTIIGSIIALAVKVGRTMQNFETLQEIVREEKAKSHEKFNELYHFKSDTEKTLAVIQNNTESIKEMLLEMKADIKKREAK